MPEIFLPRIASHTIRGFLCAQSGKVPLPSSAATMLRHQRGRGAPLWTPPGADNGAGGNRCNNLRQTPTPSPPCSPHQEALARSRAFARPNSVSRHTKGIVHPVHFVHPVHPVHPLRQSQPKSPVLPTGGKVPLPSSAATMLRHQRGRGTPLDSPGSR